MSNLHEINASRIIANIETQLKDIVREQMNSALDESRFNEAVSELYRNRRANKQTTDVSDNIKVYTQCLSKRNLKKFIRKRYYGRFYRLLVSYAISILPKINSKYIITIDGLQSLDMLYRHNCSLAHLIPPT